MTGHPPAIEGCLEACRRCGVLLDAVARQDEPLARRAYEAIGPQMRHCLDHFVCFLRGFDSGVVDYDARDRDERHEREPRKLASALESVAERLRAMEPGAVRRSLEVRQEVAPGGRSRTVGTNVERELMFLSSHTIHHIAIMILLAERVGLVVPGDLGVAFSTASHMSRAAVRPGG